MSCCYTLLGRASSPREISNNLRNINGLKFYHSIRGNLEALEAYESPCIPSAAIVRRGHRYAPTVAIPTEVLTFFRAMFWALLHPCLTTYRFIYCPNYVLIGLFRPLKWAVHSLPRARELIRAGVGILGLPCKFPSCRAHLHASWCPQGA